MKRKRNQPARKKAAKGGSPQPKPQKKMSRREILGLAKFAAVGGAIVLGGGYYFVSGVMAGIAESDLSKLGNGLPTIVQVHDPGCPSCRALQNETRDALEDFDDTSLQYLVANLASPEGREFGNKYAAGRVTLLLFDGEGRLRDRIQGRTSKEVLSARFRQHLRVSGGNS
ncbi:MAG: thioredoxin family protein [Pseudomonadota bacterium]